MVVLTFVKGTFISQTLLILLICIFENCQGAAQCEEVTGTGGVCFCSVVVSVG